MAPARCEIVIVGGGPAGALAALSLARLGRDVILCEAVAFPRDHVGICLNNGAVRILNEIGLRDAVCSPAHLDCRTMERSWEREEIELVPRQDVICDRGVLDLDLLNAAAQAGARIWQPNRVIARMRSAGGWTFRTVGPLGVTEIEASFLIEASGRRSAPRRQRLAPLTVALFARWHGSVDAVRLVSSPRSWAWAAPTARDETAALTVLDSNDKRPGELGIHETHRLLVRDAGIADNGGPIGEVTAIDVTPFESFHADRHTLRIGEAALGLDPLSSSGLSAAMQSGLAGAVATHTLLDPRGDHHAALEFVNASHARRRDQHSLHTARAYASVVERFDQPFWCDRGGRSIDAQREDAAPLAPLPATQAWIERSPTVRIRSLPCATQGKIERVPAIAAGDDDEPIAFVVGIAVVPLIEYVLEPRRAGDLLSRWAAAIGPEAALRVLSWAWQSRILIERSA